MFKAIVFFLQIFANISEMIRNNKLKEAGRNEAILEQKELGEKNNETSKNIDKSPIGSKHDIIDGM